MRTEHARKEEVWGSGEEGEKTVLLPGEKKPHLFAASHALIASLVCILRIVLATGSGARLCRFSLSFAAWGQSLRVICVRLV